MSKEQPLILVFYLDREMMKNSEIIRPFAESVNDTLIGKNTIAFFLPTDDNERIECINPKLISEPEMDKINQMVEDIKKQFSVGDNMNNVPDTEIDPDK